MNLDSISPPTFSSSLSVVRATVSLLLLCINFRITESKSITQFAGIFIVILLNTYNIWNNKNLENIESFYSWTLNISILILWFHLSEFCNFLYVNIVHILLDLYQSFSYLRGLIYILTFYFRNYNFCFQILLVHSCYKGRQLVL